MSEILGKVVATTSQPSTVDAFTFWIKSGRSYAVEVGNIMTVLDGEDRVYGMVTEMTSYTDAESAMIDYLGHEFGDPKADAPTLRQSIHLATCDVIGASRARMRPVSAGQVRLSTPEEILQAYGMDQIPDPILVGVIPNGRKVNLYAPALLSERFVIGPEGAHVNFSGASGLATKTSAAAFLIRSILSRAQSAKRRVAVVAFNVKERDFLYLEKHSEGGLEDLIKEAGTDEDRKLLDVLGRYNVSIRFDKSTVRYFAPGRPHDPDVPHSLRQDDVEPFYWSLETLKGKGAIRFEHLLDPDDLDERAIGVLATIEDLLAGEWADTEHFRDLINNLPTDKKDWRGHSGHTIAKVKRLLQINTSEILRGLFTYDDAKEQDIPLDKLTAGQCFVIDIQTLNDKGKRIVFYNVLSRLAAKLEEFKIQRDQEQIPPLDAVIVFVDELNKFAPSARTYGRGLKEQIVDIAARGRSIGLVLFGAEQFASAIDKEVYGNCSSHFVGRTDHVELADRAYRWLSRDLSFIASTLPKGTLLCKHALFTRPLLVKFPRPLHTYEEQDIDDLLQTEKKQPQPVAEEKHDTEFIELRRLLKGRCHMSPISYFKDAEIHKSFGIGQSKFVEWYKHWLGSGEYKDGSSTERNALNALLEHLQRKNPSHKDSH